MRLVFGFILAAVAAAGGTGAALAQSAAPPSSPASRASAPEPAAAASRVMPTRNPAITAAENAKEPGVQRPEERVIPQITVPLKPRNSAALAATAASAPAGSRPGTVNDDAARCLARSGNERAACERALAASAPAKADR